jgi:hypothetical protein
MKTTLFKIELYSPLFFSLILILFPSYAFLKENSSQKILIITGQGTIPKISNTKAIAALLEVETVLSDRLSDELTKIKIDNKIILQKDEKKSLLETLGDSVAAEKNNRIIIIYIQYINTNGKEIIAARLQCSNMIYKKDSAAVGKTISSTFDISSKPERSLSSIAQEFSKLIQKNDCKN